MQGLTELKYILPPPGPAYTLKNLSGYMIPLNIHCMEEYMGSESIEV